MASTVHISAAPQYRGLRMTADEYATLADDGYRYELIDGVVQMSPSPSFQHQQIVAEFARQLGNHVMDTASGRVAVEIDIRLDEDRVYRPDLVFVDAEKLTQCGERITVAPDLVLEVVSPDSKRYDHETKRHDYEAAGVTEYWLIDVETKQVMQLRLEGGKYVEQVGDARLRSRVVDGFVLDPATL